MLTELPWFVLLFEEEEEGEAAEDEAVTTEVDEPSALEHILVLKLGAASTKTASMH